MYIIGIWERGLKIVLKTIGRITNENKTLNHCQSVL